MDNGDYADVGPSSLVQSRHDVPKLDTDVGRWQPVAGPIPEVTEECGHGPEKPSNLSTLTEDAPKTGEIEGGKLKA